MTKTWNLSIMNNLISFMMLVPDTKCISDRYIKFPQISYSTHTAPEYLDNIVEIFLEIL